MQSGQGELNFGAEELPAKDGLSAWRAQRMEELRAMAKKLGLPLGKRVEVWLVNNIRLEGVLKLTEEELFLPEDRLRSIQLSIDKTPFRQSEIQSCVVLD